MPRALLEMLPAELIQDIFFLADMHPNLPRASVQISRQLTDRFVLLRFCERAFHQSSGLSKHEQRRERLMLSALQAELFSMRWMSYDFWVYFSRHWTHRLSRSAMHQKSKNASSSVTNGDLILISNENALWPRVLCPLPTKLFKTPFTANQLSFLECLLSTSTASVDWTDVHAVRLSARAKRQAILERNLEAVHVFARMRRLGKAPNLDLVKFAVLEGGCDKSIVLELLLAAREWGHQRWQDIELDAWVAEGIAAGETNAKWLGLKLAQLRSGLQLLPVNRDDDAYGVPLITGKTTTKKGLCAIRSQAKDSLDTSE